MGSQTCLQSCIFLQIQFVCKVCSNMWTKIVWLFSSLLLLVRCSTCRMFTSFCAFNYSCTSFCCISNNIPYINVVNHWIYLYGCITSIFIRELSLNFQYSITIINARSWLPYKFIQLLRVWFYVSEFVLPFYYIIQ